jgi:pimeloyl-ACP methyl ester carboxylesterase/DNA-binding CsgD family transcriptional regulator
MGHPIQYARTTDGVNIAFTALGEGEPLIYLTTLPWSNFAAGFTNPLTSRHAEEVSAGARLIIYDARGCGLSDHGVHDLTLDALGRDIDAVAEATGHDRFALYGSSDATRVMIRYAAMHPERVTRLVLWVPSVSAAPFRDDSGLRGVTSLAGKDWELYLQTLSHAVVGGWDAERAPYAAAWADVMRAAIRSEEFARWREALRTHDVSRDLAAVRAPTLVLAREEAVIMTVAVAREVAAGIPSARFVVTPGNWLLPCTDDDITREILAFMRVSPAPDNARARQEDGGMPSSSVVQNGKGPALSNRESQVLALLSEGMTNPQIAEVLVLSPATVSRHVHNLLNKLGMNRRAEAAAYAARYGIVRSGSGTS